MGFDAEKKETDELFKQLAPIAKSIVAQVAGKIDKDIKYIQQNVKSLSAQEISEFILSLSADAYFFSEVKDYSYMKQLCSEALYKENQAKLYSLASGTVADRTNYVIVENNDKLLVKILYDTVLSLMKTKLEELHRVVNALTSVQISRNAENKLKS